MKFLIAFGILIMCLISTEGAEAVVRVAFFEAKSDRGLPIQLSPGERFYHTAIQIEGLWYHSLPNIDVQGWKRIENGGGVFLSLVVEHEGLLITRNDIKSFIGLKFDKTFSWNAKGKTYCSKLVANILGINPSPMLFRGSHWSMSRPTQVGKLGVSPDELLKPLSEMGFRVSYDRHKGFKPLPFRRALAAGSCRSLL